MVKSIYVIVLSAMSIFLMGCNSEDPKVDNSKTEPITVLEESYSSWKVAKNNLVRDVSEPIGANTVKVLVEPVKQIGEDDTSKTTIVIYGNINGKNTKAKLKINENYASSTKMVVRVYSPSGDILATSGELAYTGDNIMFNDINF